MFRAFKIIWVTARYRLDRLIPAHLLPWWARLLLLPFRLFPKGTNSEPEALREALESLGPVFVKFGQILSTRKDLFPPDYSRELAKLQDQVPPFASDAAIRVVEAELEGTIAEVFAEFSETPLASASVAQVHTARLKTGEEVVVKVIRPGIEKTITDDIGVMLSVARLIENVFAEARRLHPVDVVLDYKHTIFNELNLQLEAANAARLRELWQHTGKLYVPEVHWDYCTRNVMVSERIYGVMVSDIDALNAAGTDLQKLAHLGVEIFFTQVFEHNFFHADMHPGNVFVDISDPANPTYIALDCAIIGSLTESDQNYLARNLLAFFHQDYAEVARLHVDSGWVPAHTNVEDFEAVIRSVCEPIFQKPIKEISFGKVLFSLFATARQFEMEVQPQLVLLQKTLLNIEGMGRQVYDDLDLWETAAPYMERWMSARIGVGAIFAEIRKHAPALLEKLPELPALAVNAINELQRLGETNRQQSDALLALKNELADQRKRSGRQKLGGMAILAAALGLLIPVTASANTDPLLLTSGVLGSVGIYWWFIHG